MRFKIASKIERLAAHLFRRHVGHGAQGCTRTSEQMLFIHRQRLGIRWLPGASRGKFRQPKIQNLGVPVMSDEDVGGFDVTVNDAGGMSRAEGVGNFGAERHQHFILQRAP